jgi:hypothetical protein
MGLPIRTINELYYLAVKRSQADEEDKKKDGEQSKEDAHNANMKAQIANEALEEELEELI